jgi:hypothetical protein
VLFSSTHEKGEIALRRRFSAYSRHWASLFRVEEKHAMNTLPSFVSFVAE